VVQGRADVVQVEADVVQVEADVMQGPATRRRVGVDVAQVLEIDGTDETDEIDDETDETDDGTDETETDETDEVDFSSVQREPAAGNVTQRGAERLKNSVMLVRLKKEDPLPVHFFFQTTALESSDH
jgi:hypothetical protein